MASLMQIAEALAEANRNASQAFDAAKSGDPGDMIRLFVRVKEGYDEIEAARKNLNALLESASRHMIPEIMMEKQIKTLSLEDIRKRVTVSTRINASIIPDTKEKAYEWLRHPQQDAGALIQETVNAGTLSSYAKSLMTDQGKELPPEYFKVSSMQFTSVTKI